MRRAPADPRGHYDWSAGEHGRSSTDLLVNIASQYVSKPASGVGHVARQQPPVIKSRLPPLAPEDLVQQPCLGSMCPSGPTATTHRLEIGGTPPAGTCCHHDSRVLAPAQPAVPLLSSHTPPSPPRIPAPRSLTRSVISVVFVVSTALASTLIATATFLVANQSATTVTACAIATTALAAAALTAVILLAAAFAAAIIAPATAGATVATTILLLLIRRSFGEFRRHRCATYIQAWARGRETRLALHWRSGNLRWKMQYLGWLTSRPAAAALDAATAAAACRRSHRPPASTIKACRAAVDHNLRIAPTTIQACVRGWITRRSAAAATTAAAALVAARDHPHYLPASAIQASVRGWLVRSCILPASTLADALAAARSSGALNAHSGPSAITTSHLYLEPLISRISWVYCLRWYTPRTPGTPAFCGAPYTLIADALSLPEPYPQSTHTTMPTSARQRGQRKRALAKAEQQWRFRDHVRQQFGVISHLEISGYPLYRDHDPMYAHRPTGPRGFYRRSSHYDRARLKALGLDRQYTYAPRFPSGLLESLRANRSSTKDAPPADGSPEDTSSGDDSSDDPPSDGDDHLATALAEEAANRALEQSLDKLASQPRRPQPRRERPARGDPGHWEGIIAHTLSHFRHRHRPVSEATASELPAGPSLARLPPPPREANASQLLPAATGPPSRRRRTQMLKPLGWPRRPAPPRAPLQRPDPSLTAPESEARALRGHPTDSDSDPRA